MKRLSLSLVLLVAITMIFTSNPTLVDAASLNSKINDLQKEKEKVSKEKSSVSNKVNDTEKKMEENKAQQNETKNEISELDSNLASLQEQLKQKENEIQTTNNNIAKTEEEIKQAEDEIEALKEEIKQLEEEIVELEQKIEERGELLKGRLRSIQQSGGSIKYLEVILGAQSFGDFINRATAVNQIMNSDKTIMEEQEADKKQVEENKKVVEESKQEVEKQHASLQENKKQLEGERANLVAQKQDLNNIQAELDKQRSEKQSLMANLEEEQEQLEEIKLSAQEEQQLINAHLASLEKAIAQAEAEKNKVEQYSNNQSKGSTASSGGGSGKFIYPTSGPVTSHFNPNRLHPIHNVIRPHNGTDFGRRSSADSVIKATASGVVSFSGWMGGYGNTIMITHVIDGKTYTSLYAHLRSRSVSRGQSVSQGQQIGVMGTTGSSTGVHLHFEIHPGGYKNPANPLNYL
ncbi:peptidoglycan hydrolase CwlO-like protein [Gracilibacillus halotolerans]|uniref:Peptidoglycan hydrolase CwlO-like protein n=1 Tax=Gracilibacillus halotolerans TaxID=74386 RepID=A0A841RI25_9BACI|nr:peptidoglycan DD-metalloendopeptidase family protein [Gracilibacillus halotolerans]MBB6512311.1 peptidoglycan hydrolase CwlO-like protein [Gracilibacillus halotolerans]